MGDGAHSRGVAVTLAEPLPAAPEGVMHYAPGPVTYGQFQRNGGPWLAVYKAKHDGVGWLVMEATCRPLALMPGDHVHVRAEVIEDHGDAVVLKFRGKRHQCERPIDTGLIVFLEEAKERVPQ